MTQTHSDLQSSTKGWTRSGWMRPAVVVILSLFLANCATDTTKKTASGNKYGVKASPKVIADGEPVPKGGGYDMVGKPYTVGGKLYVPREDKNYSATGTASWYGPSFHGRMTANGEVFDRESISVAHPTLPLPSYVRVTNTLNGRSIIARVNDRGPYHDDRLVDVSEQVATSLNFKHLGTARVRLDYIGRAPLEGDDDKVLLATLRTDGRPAQLGRTQQPAQVASVTPFVPQAEPQKPVAVASVPATKAATAAPAATQKAAVPAPAPVMTGKPAPAQPAAKNAAKAPVAPVGKAQASHPAQAAKVQPPAANAKVAAPPAKAQTAKVEPAKAAAVKSPPAKPDLAKTAPAKASPAAASAQAKKPPAKPHAQTAANTATRKNERG